MPAFLAVRLNADTYPVDPQECVELEQADAELLALEGETEQDIIQAARHCDALLVISAKVPASVIEALSRCRVLSRLGAGTDRIDVRSATERGIVVANVPDFCVNEQAEHAMALLLGWVRQLPFMLDAMKQGNWNARHHPLVHRLAGRTVGLVGFGASAQGVAQRCSAFGVQLLAWARHPEKVRDKAQSLGVELVSLNDLLTRADFVSIHLPLNDETRGVIGHAQLARMKPTAVLINTARGAIVDEAALIAVLREHRIGGAALDVFDTLDVFSARTSQPPTHPLLELDNVLLTPHCAGSSVESTADSKIRGARNAALVLQGRWPAHLVNPGVIPRFPLAER